MKMKDGKKRGKENRNTKKQNKNTFETKQPSYSSCKSHNKETI